MNSQDEDRYYLNKAVKGRRRKMPGIKDFVWAALRQTESPYTGPWSHKTIRRQISRYESGLPVERITQDLLSAEEDNKWRTCHIVEPEQDSIFDCEEVEFVEFVDETHKA